MVTSDDLYLLNQAGNYVDPAIYSFLTLFNGKIFCESSEDSIPVMSSYPPNRTIPSIGFNTHPGVEGDNQSICMIQEQLDDNHPYYDPEEDEEYTTGYVLRSRESKRLTVFGYAPNTNIRDCMFYQCRLLLQLAINGDYRACINYESGNCSTTGDICDATEVRNRFSIQGKCPYLDIDDELNPNYRNPINIFNKYGIVRRRIRPRSPQLIVDSGAEPVLYNFAWDIDLELINVVEYSTMPICNYRIGDEDIME